MPEIVEITVYCIGELGQTEQQRARNWFRQVGFDHDWYESVYADFETVCSLIGIDLRAKAVHLMGGGSRSSPCIFFFGFWSQGDGACFEGTYSYVPDAAKAVRDHAPRDGALHAIADALQAAQRRNFYQLRADIRHHGRYYHEHSMTIAVERDSPIGQAPAPHTEGIVIECLRDIARWLYGRLEEEYEYLASDTEIDEALEANAYTFTSDGRRFG
ncbi:antitoxin of toxin-antitoxin stability system [Aureimonas ureilytica]|uniref:Antitoxin of toxin-antitoxin stability system n=1 Tax=Aureimonas ureilytica TaxID=401562 RepID=A0A175R976_9HYPH|nr:hypothetical protein [Aureimonas ureilytica]KTQ96319.1 antitoxin of toxin-antitoxin stability system [Aureimonas ureilytica]